MQAVRPARIPTSDLLRRGRVTSRGEPAVHIADFVPAHDEDDVKPGCRTDGGSLFEVA